MFISPVVGNPVLVRDCPAAVCRNDRRHKHWSQDREATATRSTTRCAPASPKTCQLCRARHVPRLIASWNGRLAEAVAVYAMLVRTAYRVGYVSAGGDNPADRRTNL